MIGKYLTRQEVQQMLKLDRAEMLELIKGKKIKAYRIDNQIFFKFGDVDKFMVTIEQERKVDTLKYR